MYKHVYQNVGYPNPWFLESIKASWGAGDSTRPKESDCREIEERLKSKLWHERLLPDKSLKEIIEEITAPLYGYNQNVKANCHDVTGILLGEEYRHRHDLEEVVPGYLLVVMDLDWLAEIVNNSINERYIVLGDDDFRPRIDSPTVKKQNSNSQASSLERSVIKINRQHGEYNRHIETCLSNHSMVRDKRGNYIECIYDRYPLSNVDDKLSYVFLPHDSGKHGYSLKAYSEFIPS